MFTIAQSSYWAAKHLGDAGLEAMQNRDPQVGATDDPIKRLDIHEIRSAARHAFSTSNGTVAGLISQNEKP